MKASLRLYMTRSGVKIHAVSYTKFFTRSEVVPWHGFCCKMVKNNSLYEVSFTCYFILLPLLLFIVVSRCSSAAIS